ncbi:MAG: hypothetical protein RIB45_07760 [Marivibrio sp.]|uniref:hypothetical protein n=1 Tax=Marivibrio sp. TaxID=2039719 RepID=UPI0032F01FA8
MSSIRPTPDRPTPDRPIPGLAARGAVEQFLLWSLRTWVRGFDDQPWKLAEMREGFAAINAGEAGDHLDQAMTLFAGGAEGRVDINCPRCPSVTADEHNLVLAIALIQRGWEASATRLLSDWLPPAALRLCQPHFVHVAFALDDAGYRAPVRERAVRAPARAAPDAARTGAEGPSRARLH